MITTCNKCKWGKYQKPSTDPTWKHCGEVFYFCEATRNLIREASAINEDENCPNFIPIHASCDNCELKDKCDRRKHSKLDACYEWSLI